METQKKVRRVFPAELAYLLGLVGIALGCALMEHADWGVSMVVAPAYLVYRALSLRLPFFTFGMAEYALQALLLLVMILILRRVKLWYLFSFATAFLYGLVLDGLMIPAALLPATTAARLVCYAAGMLFCSAGVSLMFHTYIAPEVYELFVYELCARFGWRIPVCKTIYDLVSCAVGVALSFLFFGFGHFEGVKLGTVVCALLNGSVIGLFSRFFEKRWDFAPRCARLYKLMGGQ